MENQDNDLQQIAKVVSRTVACQGENASLSSDEALCRLSDGFVEGREDTLGIYPVISRAVDASLTDDEAMKQIRDLLIEFDPSLLEQSKEETRDDR
jgi:hypothetical protein